LGLLNCLALHDLIWVWVAVYLPYSIVTPSVVVVPC
jgi:hypothetical protein